MADDKILIRYDTIVEKIKYLDSQMDRLRGKEEQLEDELKNLGFESIADAKDWIETAQKELVDLEEKITADLDKAERIIHDVQV